MINLSWLQNVWLSAVRRWLIVVFILFLSLFELNGNRVGGETLHRRPPTTTVRLRYLAWRDLSTSPQELRDSLWEQEWEHRASCSPRWLLEPDEWKIPPSPRTCLCWIAPSQFPSPRRRLIVREEIGVPVVPNRLCWVCLRRSYPMLCCWTYTEYTPRIDRVKL